MKTLKLAIVISLLAIFASVSVVSAATSMEGNAVGYWSVAEPSPGSRVTLTVNFESGSSQTIYIYAIGVHGDWMENDFFCGPDLSDDPEIVSTGGLCSTQITLDIPTTAGLGEHSYYIGIDGCYADGTSFSWDSSSYSVTFAASSNPTPTNSGNSGSNNSGGDSLSNLLVYVGVIAAVAVIAIILAIFIVTRSNKKKAAPVVIPENDFIPPPEAPKPEEKLQTKPKPAPEPEPEPEPEEEPEQKPDEKDFTI